MTGGWTRCACSLALAVGLDLAGAEAVRVRVADPTAAAGRVQAPVRVPLRLDTDWLAVAAADRLGVAEVVPGVASQLLPAQFEPGVPDPADGSLWWRLPAGPAGERTFALREAPRAWVRPVRVEVDEAAGRYRLLEGDRLVLQYNYRTVDFPAAGFLETVPEGSRRYAVPRSDYIHPLYAPTGEPLSLDWPPDHPHHRGLYWAWPEVDWRGQRGDLHALQQVFARPTGRVRAESGPVFARLEAESEWEWADGTRIVREVAVIRAFAADPAGGRLLDLAFRLTALADEVGLARRDTNAYGGLSPRLAPLRERTITAVAESALLPGARAWGEIGGKLGDGAVRVGLASVESVLNPDYPGGWVQYPELSWLQPAFPAAGTRYSLKPGAPLDLGYRLWVHTGEATPEQLADLWAGLNRAGSPAAVAAAVARPPSGLSGLWAYRFGDSRRSQVELETALRSATADQRAALERLLVDGLQAPAATPEAKVFACQVLARIGGADSVPVLLSLLGEEPLAQAARDALLAIPGPASAAGVRAALAAATGPGRLGLLDIVARRQDRAAVPTVVPLLADPDPATVSAALAALGTIGGPEAVAALRTAALPAARTADRLAAQLGGARSLMAEGQTEAAATACQAVLDTPAARDDLRAAALAGLVAARGAAALEAVRACLRADSARLAVTAAQQLGLLTDAPAVAAVRELLPTLAPVLQVVVVEALRERGARELADALVPLATAGEEPVRVAALGALADLGGAGQVPPLAGVLAAAGPVGRAAVDCLARLRGPGVDDALLAQLREAAPAVRPAWIRVLVHRQAGAAVEALLGYAEDGDGGTRAEAWAGLEALAGEEHLPRLLAAVPRLAPDDRRVAADAVASVCERAADRARAVGLVLAAHAVADRGGQTALLPVLGRLGGVQPLAALAAAVASTDAEVSEAGVRALARCRDPAAGPVLLSVAEAVATPLPKHVLAVQALVRLAQASAEPPAVRAAQYGRLLALCRRVEEKRLVLTGLSQVRCPEALEIAAQAATVPETAAEAALAAATLALPSGNEPGLRGRRVAELLEAVVPRLADAALQARVRDYLQSLPVPTDENLALGAATRASVKSQGPYVTALAVDGKSDLASYWSGENTPAWFEADLGAVVSIDRVHLTFYWDGQRYYQYAVEVSPDGQAWQEVVDQRANTVVSRPEGFGHRFAAVPVRYVRVTILKNSVNPGAHIVELAVGKAGAAAGDREGKP